MWEGGHNCLLELELDLKNISRWPHTSAFVVCIELPQSRDIWVKCEASVVGTVPIMKSVVIATITFPC